jgi:Protein tyrosine and serine/threonine kinase
MSHAGHTTRTALCISNLPHAALQVDVYSYGIVLWELWTGREPFEGLNYHALLHQMTSAGEAMRPPLPGSADWDAAQVPGAACATAQLMFAVEMCVSGGSAGGLRGACARWSAIMEWRAPAPDCKRSVVSLPAGDGGCGAGAWVPRAAGALLERVALQAPLLRGDREGSAGRCALDWLRLCSHCTLLVIHPVTRCCKLSDG